MRYTVLAGNPQTKFVQTIKSQTCPLSIEYPRKVRKQLTRPRIGDRLSSIEKLDRNGLIRLIPASPLSRLNMSLVFSMPIGNSENKDTPQNGSSNISIYTCDKRVFWESACAFFPRDNSRFSPQVA